MSVTLPWPPWKICCGKPRDNPSVDVLPCALRRTLNLSPLSLPHTIPAGPTNDVEAGNLPFFSVLRWVWGRLARSTRPVNSTQTTRRTYYNPFLWFFFVCVLGFGLGDTLLIRRLDLPYYSSCLLPPRPAMASSKVATRRNGNATRTTLAIYREPARGRRDDC